MSILARIQDELARVHVRTGHKPTGGHLGQQLWRQLCAESACQDLPPGALIEVDECAFAYRPSLPGDALVFEPAGIREEREGGGGKGHVLGWREQLIRHQWHEVGRDRWQRDGKPPVSMGEAIDEEVRQAADRAAIKRGERPS
jgi:hypothetical protein